MALSDKEKKLLELALNAAAYPGEFASAWQKLIESLRQRGCKPEEFDLPNPLAIIQARREQRKQSRPDYGLEIYPWPKAKEGPYKGKMFKEIPPDYLRRQMFWIREDPDRAKRFGELADKIEKFLAQ